jgi:hypothetical protein
MNTSTRSVAITFRPPASDQLYFLNSLHRRTLQSVPAPLAEKMIRDFRTSSAGSSTDRSELYRYESDGVERLIALNFDEVERLEVL